MKGYVVTFTLVFLAWLALTQSLQIQELAAGLVISAGVSFVSVRMLGIQGSFSFLRPIKWVRAFTYFVVFCYAELTSHWDVIKRVFTGRLKPAIVETHTNLRTDWGRTVFANSITLTPGTLSLRTEEGGKIFIHTIAYNKDEQIGEVFDRYWRRV